MKKHFFIMYFLKTPLFEKKKPVSRGWIKLTLNNHEKKNVKQVKDFMWWGSPSTIVVYIEKKHVWAVCFQKVLTGLLKKKTQLTLSILKKYFSLCTFWKLHFLKKKKKTQFQEAESNSPLTIMKRRMLNRLRTSCGGVPLPPLLSISKRNMFELYACIYCNLWAKPRPWLLLFEVTVECWYAIFKSATTL